MKSQTALLRVKQAILSPESDLWRHAAVRPLADHIAPLAEHQAPQSDGYDLSRVPVHASGPEGGQAKVSCPLSPRTCPFGGACHTCPARVQAKLAINQPGDEYEQEADRAAEQVTHAPVAQLQRRAADQAGPTTVPPSVHEVLHSPGQPLDANTRAFMEPRFGQDFSGVRVHADAKAAESARAVNALAYTVGRDVVFGTEQYAPQTSAGQRLITHELTHVAQQSRNPRHPLALQRQQRQQVAVTLATEGQCIDARAIAQAIPGARDMVWTALTWFLSFNPRNTARVNLLLRANFRSDSEDVRELVKERLIRTHRLLQAAQNGQVTFVCAPAADAECGGREGYVLDTERNRIHICNRFFNNLTLEGRRWMLVHECAHLAGAMRLPEQYWGFFGPVSEGDCQRETRLTAPGEALGNADNYARFVWCLVRQPGIEVNPP